MKTPKFSLGSWAFSFGPFESDPWSFDRFVDYAADVGYDGIEINGFRPHPHPGDFDTTAKRTELRKEIESRGLGISGYAPDFRDVPPAVCDTAAYLAELEPMLAFMKDLDIGILRVDTVSPPVAMPAAEYARSFDRLTRTWHAAAERASQDGIRIVWEFEPGFWLNKPSEVLDVLAAIDSPAFGVLFDTSHAHMGAVLGARQTGDPEILVGGVAEYATKLDGRIGHIHLIDCDGTLHDDETSTHSPFGEGDVDFVSALEALEPTWAGFEWCCFDFCFCPTTEVDARKAIPFVKNLLAAIPD
jgi:sugar phosphate isomerase/epimerase